MVVEKKYSEEIMLDVTNYFGDLAVEDLKSILYKDNPRRKSKMVYVGDLSSSNHSFISKTTLECLGERLLNDNLSSKCSAYQLSIPSEGIVGIDHVVAMMVDHKNKEISYHDSYGQDMRKEIKDFMTGLLPEYKQNINCEQQQFYEDNDQSCALLSECNLVDMWRRRDGKLDEIKNYTSQEARKYAYEMLKDFTQETVPVKETKPKPPTPQQLEYMKRREAQTQKDFEYRMYNDPDYKEQIAEAIKNAKSKHQTYVQNMQRQKLLNK